MIWLCRNSILGERHFIIGMDAVSSRINSCDSDKNQQFLIFNILFRIHFFPANSNFTVQVSQNNRLTIP